MLHNLRRAKKAWAGVGPYVGSAPGAVAVGYPHSREPAFAHYETAREQVGTQARQVSILSSFWAGDALDSQPHFADLQGTGLILVRRTVTPTTPDELNPEL